MGPDAFDDTQGLQRHLALLLPRDIVSGKAKWPDTGAEAAFQTAFGKIIEQGDFLGDAHGIPQRQHINQRAQTNPLGALGRSAEKTAGARAFGKAQVEVMLGDKVTMPA